MIVWAVSVAILLVLWWVVAWRWCPQLAMGVAVVAAIFFPSWSHLEISGLPFNVRDVAVGGMLISYLIHPRSTYPWRLQMLDYFVLAFAGTHVMSDSLSLGFSPFHIFRSYAEWVMPYICGRLAFQGREDVSDLQVIVGWVAIVTGVLALLESFSGSLLGLAEGLRPWEFLHGEKPYENFERNTARWGLLRAWGSAPHPIYFGVIQLAWLPFTGSLFIEYIKGRRGVFGLVAVLCNIGGVCATVSLGPIAATAVFVIAAIGLQVRKLRYPILLLTAATILFGIVFGDATLNAIEELGRSTSGSPRDRQVVIQGEEKSVTSATSRIHIFSLYQTALSRCGGFGFGTEKLTQFPPDVPMKIADVEATEVLRFVDNSYLWMTLRFGWIGGALFAVLFVWSFLWQWLRQVPDDAPLPVMNMTLAAGIVACAFAISTVWFAHDLSFSILWLLGCVSGPVWRDA